MFGQKKMRRGVRNRPRLMDPRLLRFFWLPILFPVVKNGTIKGGAGGLPLQRKPKSNKGVQGVSPCKKDITCKKEGGGCRGAPPAKKKKKKFSSFSSCNYSIRFILADI